MARILIVDDATFIREILLDLLSKSGWVVVGQAEDGEQAVEMAGSLNPDLIFMDLVLPKKNGIEASREILSKHPEIKIIACSTLDQEDFLLKALEVGCCSYLTKPFSSEQVIGAVKSAFKK